MHPRSKPPQAVDIKAELEETPPEHTGLGPQVEREIREILETILPPVSEKLEHV